MVGSDLSASAKLSVAWIIIPIVLLHCKPNLRFDLSYLVFYWKFCAFRIIIFSIVSFQTFYHRE